MLARRTFAGLVAVAAAHALSGAPTITLRFTDAKDAAVADAVVSLHPLDAGAPPAVAHDRGTIEVVQQGQEFEPYVTVVHVGTEVVFPNHDAVRHHVYSLSKAKRFEIPLFGRDTRSTILFDQPGVVTLGCNIHDWMVAYIVVVPTPLFAKSGADGRAAVAEVPAGNYRVEIWHPRLAEIVRREMAVVDGATPVETAVVLTLKPDRRIRRAPDGARGGYP